MSSSAAGRGDSSASTSSIVADGLTGHHSLKIDGYSLTKGTPTGTSIKSSQFTVGGHRWHIDYYPNGNRFLSADYISIYLTLDEWATNHVKAQAKFKFQITYAGQVDNPLSKSSTYVDTFYALGHLSWGFTKFVKREDFEKSNAIRDDSFTIRCDIVVVRKIRTEETTKILPADAFVSVPPSDMNQQLGDLLETKKGADVVFDVDGETFAAHRCVLAARSPVFGAELYGSMKEGDPAGVVRIEDMDARVFKVLLRFVFTDSLPEMKKNEEAVMCQHLLIAADRYNLQRLKLICEKKLCKYISMDTISDMLALADQHHCNGLTKACCNFITSPPASRNWFSVMQQQVLGCWHLN